MYNMNKNSKLSAAERERHYRKGEQEYANRTGNTTRYSSTQTKKKSPEKKKSPGKTGGSHKRVKQSRYKKY